MRSYQVKIQGAYAEDDGFKRKHEGPTIPADVTCPDCGGRATWAEEGGVPGKRACKCGSLYILAFKKYARKKVGQDRRELVCELTREKFYNYDPPAFLD